MAAPRSPAAVPVPLPSPGTKAPPPDGGGHRFAHVDALRAVAALLVAWIHLSELFWPQSRHEPSWMNFLYTLPRQVNFGRLGVVLFFGVSGFVVCRSLERDGSRGKLAAARRFVIKRFCRLYPAFWVSAAAGVVVWWLHGWPLTAGQIAANAVMLPGFLGQTALFGLYWTLETELAFYGCCLLLFWVGGLQRPWVLCSLSLLLSALPRFLNNAGSWTGLDLHLHAHPTEFCYNLAVMFWGAYLRTLYDATDGFRQRLWQERWSVLALAAATVWISLVPDKHLLGWMIGTRHIAAPTYVPYPVALLGFVLWVAVCRIRPPALVYLGVISYSLYLFHPLAFHLVTAATGGDGVSPEARLPLWLLMLAAIGVAVATAAAVYRWVERPGIALGRRWEKSPGRRNEPVS